MKRIIIYIGILAMLFAAPLESADVGKLLPVQVVQLRKENGWVVLETDTENVGMGGTAKQALQNLKDTASGIIYLDTAEYLLLSKDAEDALTQLRTALKPKTGVCYAEEGVDLKEAGKFLSAHAELPRLKEWKEGQELPIITTFRKRLTFLKKVENNA